MDMQKLLIADGTDGFAAALAEHLQGSFVIRLCREGHDALEQLCAWEPDVMILDLMLPGLDGLTLLQMAQDAGVHPIVLATTRYLSDYVLEAAEQLQISYIMMKPCDIHAVISRIVNLTQSRHSFCPDLSADISKLLMTLGIPTKLRGYLYLQKAILESIRHPHQQVTKTLYPTVAQLTDSSPTQVERSIRSAISAAWSRRDEQLWQLYFQCDGCGRVPRPTNAAFITRLADRLSLRRSAAPVSPIPTPSPHLP